MFDAEKARKLHYDAIGYTVFPPANAQIMAVYQRMAEAINEQIAAREQEYQKTITALVELLECDPVTDYGDAYHERYATVLARAKALMQEAQ